MTCPGCIDRRKNYSRRYPPQSDSRRATQPCYIIEMAASRRMLQILFRIIASAILATASAIDTRAASMSRSVQDIGGDILLVSQFTLFASTRKGTKPSWHRAAKPETAIPLYDSMVARLTTLLGRPVATGRFGAMMEVALVNDGPVTLLLDTKARE